MRWCGAAILLGDVGGGKGEWTVHNFGRKAPLRQPSAKKPRSKRSGLDQWGKTSGFQKSIRERAAAGMDFARAYLARR